MFLKDCQKSRNQKSTHTIFLKYCQKSRNQKSTHTIFLKYCQNSRNQNFIHAISFSNIVRKAEITNLLLKSPLTEYKPAL